MEFNLKTPPMNPPCARILVSFIVLLVTTVGCSKSEEFKDATIVKKKNLFKQETYSLNSPSFSLGKKQSFLFEFRDLKHPGYPSWIIFSPYDGPSPAPFQACSLTVSFEDPPSEGLVGKVFFSTTLTLSSIKANDKGYWPHSMRLYDVGKHPELKSSYNIRISVIMPSARPSDTAYLHSFSFDEERLY